MQYDGYPNSYIMMDERQSIKDSLRNLRKYGSTSINNYSKVPEEFIKHIIIHTDTLQGIALKYGVTTEQIRRANKLWANDSLFLRESLLIPIKSKSLPSTSMHSFDLSDESDLFLNQSVDEVHPFQNGVRTFNSSHPSSSICKSGDDIDNIDNFLHRIDVEVATKTQQVKLTQNKSSFVTEISDFGVRRKPAMSRLKQQQQKLAYDNHNFSDIPFTTSQSKRVRNSLEILQQEDEIFEL